MIRFYCKNCGQKFSVSEVNAGKKGRCPKCKNVIVIPGIEDAESMTNHHRTNSSGIGSKDSVLDPNLFEITQNSKEMEQGNIPDEALDNLRKLKSVEVEPPPERKLPWPIDIFLYPANFQGMIFLAIAVLIPLVLEVAALFLCVFGLLFFLLNAVI